MAVTITSYTPTTGPASGGTECTVTGTGLLTVEAVLVGPNEAVIETGATDTQLKFRTPAGAAGAVPVALYDGSTVVEASTQFTYTAVPASESVTPSLAGKWALDVRNIGDTDYTMVRSVTSGVKPSRAYTSEDDSDTDSGIDGSDFITMRKNTFDLTVSRKRGNVSGNYDPGQEILRTNEEITKPIEGRVYDRTGGPEAWSFTALVQWSPKGGNKTADQVDVSLLVQGPRTVIANPVLADPTLAGIYVSS